MDMKQYLSLKIMQLTGIYDIWDPKSFSVLYTALDDKATLTIFFGPRFLRQAQNVPDKKENWHSSVIFIFSSDMSEG